MATCKDCLSYGACDNIMKRYAGYDGLNPDGIDCGHFKDKSRYVEVVRCKDCKRCFEKRTKRHNNLMRFCMRVDGNEFQVNANDFCSYGERKCDNE